jgi:hypothetical protein
VESGAFQLFDGLIEINQAAFRREIEDAEPAGYGESFSFSRPRALAIVH